MVAQMGDVELGAVSYFVVQSSGAAALLVAVDWASVAAMGARKI